MMTLMIPSEAIGSEGLIVDEVAARAGVTPRTIHYYVAQGLLPGPGKQGPRTRYSLAFLDLLLRIRMLQDERGLSLRSIRELFVREGVIPPRVRGRRSSRATATSPRSRDPESVSGDDVRSSDAGTGDVASRDVRIGDAGSSDAGSGDAGSGDARIGDTGTAEAGVEAETSVGSPTATDLLQALQELVGERRVPSAGSGDRWVTIPISRDLVLAGRRLRNDDLHALQRAADHLRFILLNGKRS